MIALRSIERAIAWRTLLSVKGATSVRMWIWRWADVGMSITVVLGSLSSPWPLLTENCVYTSRLPAWKARIAEGSLSKNLKSRPSRYGWLLESQYVGLRSSDTW